jgi:hypothetical protein
MRTKIKFLVILAILPFLVVIFLQPFDLTSGQNAPTAAQKFKNIKVLNEMPADQMGKVMNLFSASLGVKCVFCHKSENDFASDDNEHKQIAREMIKMTFEINKNHFENRVEVTCNTCHNGKTHPQSVPNLNARDAPRPKQPNIKPNVDEILAKYEQALGGRANLDKIVSRYAKAVRVEPNGESETEEIWQKGDKLFISTVYPKATIIETFDGAAAWKRAGGNAIVLKNDEAEQIRRNAEIFAGKNLKTVYAKLEFGFVDRIDGREVYQIRATTAEGARERLFFDRENGLLVRRTAAVPTVLGIFVYQFDYADYKDFGGVKLALTMKFAVPGFGWTRKIEEVKINPIVDEAKFVEPAK